MVMCRHHHTNIILNDIAAAGVYPEIENLQLEEWNWDFYYEYNYDTNTYWVCQFYRLYLYNVNNQLYDIATDEVNGVEWTDTYQQ